jgi:hypothetical protein
MEGIIKAIKSIFFASFIINIFFVGTLSYLWGALNTI